MSFEGALAWLPGCGPVLLFGSVMMLCEQLTVLHNRSLDASISDSSLQSTHHLNDSYCSYS